VTSSVDVDLVAAAFLQAAEIVRGGGLSEAALLLDDGEKGTMDVGRKPCAVAADIEVSAFLKPGVEVARLVHQPVLDIGLRSAVAREGHIHARQDAVLEKALPFRLIEEVAIEIAFAEDQPGFAGSPARLALLEEGAIGRDAGSRPDHDDRRIVVRQAEAWIGLDIDRQHGFRVGMAGELAGGDAEAFFAVQRIAYGA